MTVHDAALVVSNAAEQVRKIMIDEFRKYDVEATVRVKPGAARGVVTMNPADGKDVEDDRR